jgi:hypothetical protein
VAQTTATIDAPLGQRGPYEVALPFTISGERQAFLQVLSRSARDGGITSLNAVGLTVAATGPEEIRTAAAAPARVTIYEPAPLQTVSGGTVSVSGFGLASFEQTLVVEVLDAAGNVAGSEPVTVESVALGAARARSAWTWPTAPASCRPRPYRGARPEPGLRRRRVCDQRGGHPRTLTAAPVTGTLEVPVTFSEL